MFVTNEEYTIIKRNKSKGMAAGGETALAGGDNFSFSYKVDSFL
jgi:hypothetical protein